AGIMAPPRPIDPNRLAVTDTVVSPAEALVASSTPPAGTGHSDLVRRALAATEPTPPPLSPALATLLAPSAVAPANEEALFSGWQGQQITYRRLTPMNVGQDVVIYIPGPDSKTDLATHQLIQDLNRNGVTVWSFTPDASLDWTRHLGNMRAFVDFVRGQEPGKRIHLVAVSASSSAARLLVEESPEVTSFTLISPAFELTETRVKALAALGLTVPSVLLPPEGRSPISVPTLAVLAGDDREVVNSRTEGDLDRDFRGYHQVRTFVGRPHQIFTGNGADSVVRTITDFIVGHPWEATEAEARLQSLLGAESLFAPGERQISEEGLRNNVGNRRAILRHPAYRRLQALYRDHAEELPPETHERAGEIIGAVDNFFERQRQADRVDVRQLTRRFILPYPDVTQFALAGVSYYDNASLEEVETVDALRFVIERYSNAANVVNGDVTILERSPEESWRLSRTHVRAVATFIQILRTLPNYDDLLARNIIRPDILANVERRLGEIRELIQNRPIQERAELESGDFSTNSSLVRRRDQLATTLGELIQAAPLFGINSSVIARLERQRERIARMAVPSALYARPTTDRIYEMIYRLYSILGSLSRSADYPSDSASVLVAALEREVGQLTDILERPVSRERLLANRFGEEPFFPSGKWRLEEERWRLYLAEPRALLVHPVFRRLQALYRKHADEIPDALKPRAAELVGEVDRFFEETRVSDQVDSRALTRRYLLPDPGVASFATRLLQPYGVELEELETVGALARLTVTLFNDAATVLMNDAQAGRSAEESWRDHNLYLNLASRALRLLQELPIYGSLLASGAIRPDVIEIVERRLEQIRTMVRDNLVRDRELFPHTPLTENEIPRQLDSLQRNLELISRAASLFGLDSDQASLLKLLSDQIIDLYPAEPLYGREAVAEIRATYQEAYDFLLRLCGSEKISGMERSALIGQVRDAINTMGGLLTNPPPVALNSLPPATAEEIPSLTARLLGTEELHDGMSFLGYADDDARPFEAYALKLRLLQASGVFPGTALYLAGGMDYLPAAAGPLITVDRADELGSGAFFGVLRNRLGRLEVAQYLPTGEEARKRIRMVRSDVTDTANWWPQVAGQNVRTLVLKNFAESVSTAGGDAEAVKNALRFVGESLPSGAFVVLFAEDVVWEPLFEESGFTRREFPDEVQRALAVKSGWGRLAFDTKLYYGIATVSGGPVIVLQKGASGISYRSSPPAITDPSRRREGEELLPGSEVVGVGVVARELLPPLEEGARRAFPEPDSPPVLEARVLRLIR
ncbi:MAG: hypothetical protein Q7S98_01635, partial [Deltaproteobacteria bacterium]|nr:hypothetical protein [Deltaproteobacteria bacterium]